jgi:uridine phosphorylase
VSVIATGMGAPMMDFVVRESRAVVAGPMAILRYGTCGGLGEGREGSVVIPDEGSILVRRDPDAVGLAIEEEEAAAAAGAGASPPTPTPTSPSSTGFLPTRTSPYSVSRPVRPHRELTALLADCFRARLGAASAALSAGSSGSGSPPFSVRTGVMDATADSFYSSQGRTNETFVDHNAGLVERLERAFPLLACLQMETFHLFDLGRAARADKGRAIAASAAAIVIVNRTTGAVASKRDVEVLELEGGRACLDALVTFEL